MDKIYLILGASSEVGMAYMEHLISLGKPATVLAHYRNHNSEFDRLCEVNSEVNIIPIQADLSKEEDVEKMISYIEDAYGFPTHILHLPAGKLEYSKIKKLDWDRLQDDFKIQILSLGKVLQAFLPQMAKKRYGKVAVMLSSVTIGMPPKFMMAYTINKYALLGLLKSASIEYADKGININGISPNMMETKFLRNIDERFIEMAASSARMQRNIQVKEVIPAIQFLLSEGSDYMNGVNINLSGGDK